MSSAMMGLYLQTGLHEKTLNISWKKDSLSSHQELLKFLQILNLKLRVEN